MLRQRYQGVFLRLRCPRCLLNHYCEDQIWWPRPFLYPDKSAGPAITGQDIKGTGGSIADDSVWLPATAVGRIDSGGLHPVQKRGPEFRAQDSGNDRRFCRRLIPFRRVPFPCITRPLPGAERRSCGFCKTTKNEKACVWKEERDVPARSAHLRAECRGHRCRSQRNVRGGSTGSRSGASAGI